MTGNHLLLYRLAELMLEKEQHVLPVDDLFDDEQIGDFVKSIQIDSPYQQLLFEGVLTESVKEEQLYVSFTVEGYFHYVLGEVIYIKTYNENRSSDYILKLLLKSEIKGITASVQNALLRFINSENHSHLIWLIDNSLSESMHLFTYPFYFFIQKKSIEFCLEKLLHEGTRNDYELIFLLIEYLDQNGKHELINAISKYIIEKINLDPVSIEHSKLIIIIIYHLKSRHDSRYGEIIRNVVQFAKNNTNKKYAFEIAYYLTMSEYFEHAIFILKKLISYNKEAYNLLGIYYFKSKKYKLSFRYFLKYQNHVLKIGDERKIAQTKYNLSTLYWEFKDFQSALSVNYEALDIERKIIGQYNNSYLISLFSIALNLRLLHQYHEAEEILDSCLKIANNTIDSKNKFFLDIYLIRGANYSDLDKTEESIANYENAIEYYNENEPLNRNPLYFLQEQYFKQAETMFASEKYLDSEMFFLKSINAYNQIPKENQFIPPFFELANCYKEIKNYRLSIEFYEKAISNGIYIKNGYFHNPKFWIGIVYYELGNSFLHHNDLNEQVLECFKNSQLHLSKWKRKVNDSAWREYVLALLKYMDDYLKNEDDKIK
jgi:tetratricopeptide (TPR) repeat protein